jgi:uncharacterized protein
MDQAAAELYILGKLRHGLPRHRTYHSLSHTLDVYRTVVEIGTAEGITGEKLDLLRTAALFHDTGFLFRDTEHEEGSCILAREALPGFGYTTVQVETICEMIMATKIPQRPKNKLSRILCDADLDYLGRQDFHRIGSTLFAEFVHYGVVRTEREWNEMQVRFLTKHHYWTARNKALREPVKQAHLQAVRQWLDAHDTQAA